MNRSKSLGVALATVLIGGGALALAGFALATATPHQKAAAVRRELDPGTHLQHYVCHVSRLSSRECTDRSGGPHPDWVTYSNDNIDVPAHTTIDVTIDQYDSGGAANNPYFDNVIGTNGGFDTVNGVKTTHVGVNDIGHTFTLHAIPGNGKTCSSPYRCQSTTGRRRRSISARAYPKPVVVKFSFTTGGADDLRVELRVSLRRHARRQWLRRGDGELWLHVRHADGRVRRLRGY